MLWEHANLCRYEWGGAGGIDSLCYCRFEDIEFVVYSEDFKYLVEKKRKKVIQTHILDRIINKSEYWKLSASSITVLCSL